MTLVNLSKLRAPVSQHCYLFLPTGVRGSEKVVLLKPEDQSALEALRRLVCNQGGTVSVGRHGTPDGSDSHLEVPGDKPQYQFFPRSCMGQRTCWRASGRDGWQLMTEYMVGA